MATYVGLILGQDSVTPLTEEAIVRRHVAGATAAQLVELIRSNPPAFDLSEEMLEELRQAGLPEVVIRAMVDRQAEAQRAIASTTTTTELPGAESTTARLTVTIAASKVRIPTAVPPDFARSHGIETPKPVATGAALVLVCRVPEHVPDRWRSRTPLGKDFVNAARHELLAFVALSSPDEAAADQRTPSKMQLIVPAKIEAELARGIAHDISLFVALEIEERWLVVAEARKDGVNLDAPLSLPASVAWTGTAIEVKLQP